MKKRSLVGILGNIFVCLYAIFLLLPIYFIITTSLKSEMESNLNPIGFPSKILFSNFVKAFIEGKIAQSSINSIIITTCTIILSMIINVLLAFGLFKLFNKKIGVTIYSFIMFGMMVAPVGYVNLIILYRQLHLYNSLLGVIFSIAAGSVPFSVFLLVGHFRSVPKDVGDAATIDGCSELQTLIHVLVPLSKPILATIAILNLVQSWNNLLTPLLLLKDEELQTIPLSLLAFRGNYTIKYNLFFAALLITSIPLLVIYLKFQKNFVESLSGSMKG